MAIASLLLSLLAGLLCLLGFLTALIPVVGSVLSFAAPITALVGVSLGGVAWSRARDAGRGADLPVAAVVMNVLALIPALLVAFTCGVCNAMVSSGPVHIEKRFGVQFGTLPDGGLDFAPPGFPPRDLLPEDFPPPDSAASDPAAPNGPVDPDHSPSQPGPAAPPELPPPSLPAGPRTPLPKAPDALP